MVSSRALLLFSAALSCAFADPIPELGERAPFEAFGILNKGLSGTDVAENEYVAGFAPDNLLGAKNATEPLLKDRSLELTARQSCDAGYWYCASFGKCCPQTSLCCSYGYCIDPGDTCCPDAPCQAGWGCCGPNCYPEGGDCCSDYNYCEAGNICVRIPSENNRIVCCTDLQCTAAVVSGTTSYVSTVQQTQPPATTQPPAITAPPGSSFMNTQTVGGGDLIETWYWTVTWWYYSFWWTTYRPQTSSVTYTKIYSTTTFTTTATDEEQASSEFSVLSETLSFAVPASAETSLAYYITANTAAASSMAESTGFTFNPGAFSTGEAASSTSASVNVITRTVEPSSSSVATTGASTETAASAKSGGVTSRRADFMQWALGVVGVGSGFLMVWL